MLINLDTKTFEIRSEFENTAVLTSLKLSYFRSSYQFSVEIGFFFLPRIERNIIFIRFL